MGNFVNKEAPPPVVLVPPIFDFPPLAARIRMLESSYDMLFGKLALKCLFEDYFEEAKHFSTRFMLRPIDDPNVDLVATAAAVLMTVGSSQTTTTLFPTSWASDGRAGLDERGTFSGRTVGNYFPSKVELARRSMDIDLRCILWDNLSESATQLLHCEWVSGPFDHKTDEKMVANALFRWQRDVDDPNTFIDLLASNSEPVLRMRSCAYYPKYGFGAFGIFPFLVEKRTKLEDFCIMGMRYGSRNLSVGATLLPFSSDFPRSAWLVSRLGRVMTGVEYKPKFGSNNYKDLENWSFAIGYGLGSTSPLSPSFNFALELARTTQLIASFYQHIVVQRQVQNPFEGEGVVGITNYIDFGFELETRINPTGKPNSVQDSTFQIAASWQANKNFMLKGKAGPLSSSLALAFKSWWKPAFTFSISATRDRVGKTAIGFGVHIEDLREASYQRADPNYVMLTPSKEHLAEGMLCELGKRPMLQSDLESGNFEDFPRDLRPLGKIL